jgi:exodeoxyribonuclease V alpha subunit
MSGFTPTGTARLRFLRARAAAPADGTSPASPERGQYLEESPLRDEADALEPAYLGWEVARCARGLDAPSREALAAVAAACVAAIQSGSTRIPVGDGGELADALEAAGRRGVRLAVLSLLARARQGDPNDPVCSIIGHPGDRRPLVLDGEWLSTERMCKLEARFCERVLARTSGAQSGRLTGFPPDGALGRALSAVAEGPPRMTPEQKRAVKHALSAPLGLVTGGPGTGKTTIVVALVRALAWSGLPMASLAIAAPTGKAAQRLQEAISAGLALAARDIADTALASLVPPPQTIHRLLGWSPSSGRFARHENDTLPCRFVIVDEASMIDLALMERLFRALRPEARLVLLGDADQLPSIEAGAVFRDLCAALGAARLTANLRVSNEAGGERILEVARAVNAGSVEGVVASLGAQRHSAREVAFEGIEHLAAPWGDVGDSLLERWWQAESSRLETLSPHVSRTYRLVGRRFDEDASPALNALLAHHQRARFLCATRVKGLATSAESINRQILERWRARLPRSVRYGRGSRLCPGAPVMVERNDYERGLFNGDLGLVVHGEDEGEAGLFVAFRRRGDWVAFPLESLGEIAPAFAVTVHKAQGSEHEQVVAVLPETDIPLLTREWLYTALTRARRSVLIVGSPALLTCAVTRRVERYSGIREKLMVSRG